MVGLQWNFLLKWMMTGGAPITQETSLNGGFDHPSLNQQNFAKPQVPWRSAWMMLKPAVPGRRRFNVMSRWLVNVSVYGGRKTILEMRGLTFVPTLQGFPFSIGDWCMSNIKLCIQCVSSQQSGSGWICWVTIHGSRIYIMTLTYISQLDGLQ